MASAVVFILYVLMIFCGGRLEDGTETIHGRCPRPAYLSVYLFVIFIPATGFFLPFSFLHLTKFYFMFCLISIDRYDVA